MPRAKEDQEQLDGMPKGLTNCHVSFGAMNIKVDKEPAHRDQVYLLIGGKVKTKGDASSGETGINITVVGDARFISKAEYEQLTSL